MASLNLNRNLKSAVLLFLLVVFYSQTPLAQGLGSAKQTAKYYRGLEGSFGSRVFTLHSDIRELNQASCVMGGGQVGIVYGNETIRARLVMFGYFFSTGSMKGSIDLYTNNASINFYPLSLLTRKSTLLQPYLTSGVAYTQMKFYGYYLHNDNVNTPINYSNGTEPFLGRVNQLNGFVGAGLDVNLHNYSDFVQVFTELRYGSAMSKQTRYSHFIGTAAPNQIVFNIGVRFGAKGKCR
jgi:hypothetical protein